VEKAVLKTIIYADLFDFPLKKEEIWQRLIWEDNKNLPKTVIFNQALTDLKKRGKLIQKDGFWFLPGKEKTGRLRKEREKEAEGKLKKAGRIAKVLKVFPSVKFVGLTGSVAVGNAGSDDDIDFMIITSSGWLWITRFLITGLFSLLGLRRRPRDCSYSDKICLNLFLDETNLDYFSREPNLFIAYEISQLKPIWQRSESYQKFLSANSWVRKFLINAKVSKKNLNWKRKSWFNPLEWLFYLFQLLWMRKKKTREIVTPHLIAFHPRNLSQDILSRFKEALDIVPQTDR